MSGITVQIFKTDTIHLWCRRYLSLLEHIVFSPNKRLLISRWIPWTKKATNSVPGTHYQENSDCRGQHALAGCQHPASIEETFGSHLRQVLAKKELDSHTSSKCGNSAAGNGGDLHGWRSLGVDLPVRHSSMHQLWHLAENN